MSKPKKKTRLEELQDYARTVGLYVATWSPGDGLTRYRFFTRGGNTYFGPDNGVYTALGIKDAWNYLYGGSYYKPGRKSARSHSTIASAHARKRKLSHHEAKQLLEAEGVDFSRDYHASVSMSQGNRIAEVARQAGYRKRKDAPGSTARMYFQYLRRMR